jgi:hypothetical protein
MEHEFLTPIPSVSNERFGEKGRKARRDRGEIYTMRFTDRFIKDQLLGLLLNPPKETSAEKILDASWLLFKQLAEKTSCYRELAAGYNRFCDFIDAGNEAGAWSYPAVARAHQLPLQKLLRDAPWQKNSIALHVLDTAIQRHVAQGDPALFEEPEMLTALLVFYAATLSGICTPPALKALVLTAVSDPEIYCTERWDEAWVLLSIGDAKVTNVCVGEERQRVERHFLDPLTVSLISRIASTDLSLDINSIDPNRLIGWIRSSHLPSSSVLSRCRSKNSTHRFLTRCYVLRRDVSRRQIFQSGIGAKCFGRTHRWLTISRSRQPKRNRCQLARLRPLIPSPDQPAQGQCARRSQEPLRNRAAR